MAKFGVLFLLFWALLAPAGSVSFQQEGSTMLLEAAVQSFDEGNVQLLNGQFSAALELYTQADQGGWASAELYYNMSLAYHRLNKAGLAVLYLEKAKRLSPSDVKVLHALSVANHRQADRFSQLPDPFWQKIRLWLVNRISVFVAFGIGLSMWIGLIGLIIGKMLFGLRGDWWRRARILTGSFAFCLIFYALTTSAWPPIEEKAVILSPEAGLHELADNTSKEILRIHEGLVITVKNRSGDWAFVEVSNGSKGWVSTSLFETI
ncbi:MAG: hypothetical protein O3B41_06595 [Bacteroidetes bacterium]|nr:hypothetical protein [Bacteroidota bacterium]